MTGTLKGVCPAEGQCSSAGLALAGVLSAAAVLLGWKQDPAYRALAERLATGPIS